ncbi:hypothetical protein BXT86_01915, partial [candidate division WOR-3 bacterium 4484_100]
MLSNIPRCLPLLAKSNIKYGCDVFYGYRRCLSCQYPGHIWNTSHKQVYILRNRSSTRLVPHLW